MTDVTALRYTSEHEWVAVEDDPATAPGRLIATVGITAYAADKLGDVVYVDLPAVGSTVAANSVVGEIESTKSVGELYAPVDGEVVEVNEAVVADPGVLNNDPFGAGWLIKVRCTRLPDLLDHAEYSALIGE